MFLRYLRICSAVVIFPVASFSLVAQPELMQDSLQPKSVEPSETIVVTGSRQQSDLLSLTGNVERILSGEIALVSAVHPSDILNRAAGVHIQANNGMESLPSLRSPVLTGPGAAGAFLFLEDGIATRAAGFANNNGLSELNLAQAQEIEIIRGPASAVYGSNAVHGVVNVLTKAPGDDAQFSLLAGPNERYQLQGDYGRNYDKQGIRATFQAIDDSGYRDNSDFNSLKLGLRHDYESGDDQFKTLISAFALDQKTAGFISSKDNAINEQQAGCYSSEYSDDLLYQDSQAMEKNCDTNAFRKWSSVRISTRWQRQLSADTSVNITPYFRANEMEFRQHYLPSKAIEENSHHSLGLLTSYNWQLNQQLALVMGVDLELTQGALTQTQQMPDSFGFGKARQQGRHYDYEVDVITIAPYIQGDYQVNDLLKLTASARFDSTKYSYDNLLADGTTKADGSACVDNAEQAVSCLYKRPGDDDNNFDDSSTKLGFNYRLGAKVALFGAWAQGFRAPQTTDLYRLQQHQEIGAIESEQIQSTELGLRGVSDKLSYEVVAYYMEKENFFFRDARGLNVTDGETSHRGVELGLQYEFNDNFDLALNYSYGRHRYEFDRANSGVVNGNEIDTAPQNLANVRFGWMPWANSRLELEWLHMAEYYLDPANEHRYKGHNLLQLRGSQLLTENISLFARIENLTDEEYATRADFAFGSYRFFGGQPRALHIGVSATF